jgi:hypothetical protein
VVDKDGRVINYNQQFVELWNLDAETMAQGEDAAVMAKLMPQVSSPEEFRQRVAELYADLPPG